MDLATIANISMLIVEEEVFGYYLYGKVPWESSDIPLEWLSAEMNNEAKGKYGSKSRGLPQSRSSRANERIQVYQAYIPLQLREDLRALANSTPKEEELSNEAYERRVHGYQFTRSKSFAGNSPSK